MSSMRSPSSSDQHAHAVQMQGFLAHQLLHAAGRADHHVRVVLERGQLRLQRHAAAQQRDLQIGQADGQATHGAGDLVGQLARGAQHQRLGLDQAGVHPRQQPQGEGGGLAAAGRRLGDEVAPVENGRQRARLDFGGAGVAGGVEAAPQRVAQRQCREIIHAP